MPSKKGPSVSIVRTGVANLASVMAGFKRIGAQPHLTADPAEIDAADYAVLPGVGSFGVAMQELRSQKLEDILRQRIESDRPTLCVCLGLHLLGATSEESPGAQGMELFPVSARRFSGTIRVPQLGWNKIEASTGCEVLKSGYVYFANSFRWTEVPEGWNGATAEHGGRFVAAIEKGRVLACQFHPELSGAFGLDLLRDWLARGVEQGLNAC